MNRRDRLNGRSLRDTAPPSTGLLAHISNTRPLSQSAGKVGLTCAQCGLHFERYACWLKNKNKTYPPCCSRACSAEQRKMFRVDVACYVCKTEMKLTQSQLGKKTTCSKACSDSKRRGPQPRLDRNKESKAALMKIAARGTCSCCGTSSGPWVIRGFDVSADEHGALQIRTEQATLWCRHCHLTDLIPIAAIARSEQAMRTNMDELDRESKPAGVIAQPKG